MKVIYKAVSLSLAMILLCGCSDNSLANAELGDISGIENTHSYQLIESYNYTKDMEDSYIDKTEYENPLDLSHLNDISFSINDQSVDIMLCGTLGDIDTDCTSLITPVCNITDITNRDLISIDYIVTEDNIEKDAFKVVSYAVDSSDENISFSDRKVNYITAQFDNKMYVFDTIVDKNIDTFISKIGNPTYKYTNEINDPYNDSEKDTLLLYSYVYKTDKFSLILFSYDDKTIDRISIEIM